MRLKIKPPFMIQSIDYMWPMYAYVYAFVLKYYTLVQVIK